jgi:hypothetical protein
VLTFGDSRSAAVDEHALDSVRAQQIAEVWRDLHVDSKPQVFDSMVPLFARTVAPEDGKWGPAHPHWAAVTALITRDLHADIDASAARAQTALAAVWIHALDQSLSDRDLDQALGFFHSARGHRYLDFQARLLALDTPAGLDMVREMSAAQAPARVGTGNSAAGASARRIQVQGLSLQLLLLGSQPQAIQARELLSQYVLATRADQLDGLATAFASDLDQFDRFNHSAVVGKIVAAEARGMAEWSKSAEMQEMQGILVSEPEKHAAEWKAAYASP